MSTYNSRFSLEGTNLILKSILRNVNMGRYLDVGANHPILCNHTYPFYQHGWRGVAVEGHEKFFVYWSQVRSEDIFLNSVVSVTVKEVTFTIFPDDTMGSIDTETANCYLAKFDDSSVQSRTVVTTTLYGIWTEHIKDEVHLPSLASSSNAH